MKLAKINEALPDEILLKILQIGVQKSILGCRDICSLSLSCKSLHRLSDDDTLWSTLQTLDFPLASSQPNTSEKDYYKVILKCHLQHKLKCDERRLDRLEDRLGVLGRKIKRLGRELRFIDVQMGENSGELLDMIQDRYVICRWEFSKVKKKHTHIQNKVAGTLAEIMKVDHRLQTLRFVCDGANIFVNDKEASSSECYEDISEAESEEIARDT